MKDITLGKTNLTVRRIGFGGIPIQRLTPGESDRVIGRAVEMGINFFDTSRIYTDSEEKLGRVLPPYRHKVVIASKSYSRDSENIRRDLETGLQKLRTDCIDLYQCHNIGSEKELDQVLAPGGALEALDRAQQQGKIRFIGISSHKPWILEQAVTAYDFKTIQFPFNIIESACQQELIPLAKEKGIGTIAMKPVAGGALREVVLNLRYILGNGADVAIPGMDKVEQIPQNLSALENPAPLDDTEMALLNKEKEEWSGNFCRRCEYCLPCPEGINIPFLHLLGAYYFRYNLKEWAWERLHSLPKTYTDCTACGQCIEKCPYDLPTPDLFTDTWHKILTHRQNR
jgi:hypothetical protein